MRGESRGAAAPALTSEDLDLHHNPPPPTPDANKTVSLVFLSQSTRESDPLSGHQALLLGVGVYAPRYASRGWYCPQRTCRQQGWQGRAHCPLGLFGGCAFTSRLCNDEYMAAECRDRQFGTQGHTWSHFRRRHNNLECPNILTVLA